MTSAYDAWVFEQLEPDMPPERTAPLNRSTRRAWILEGYDRAIEIEARQRKRLEDEQQQYEEEGE